MRKSLVTAEEETLPNLNNESHEATVLRQFSEARGCPLEDIKGILSRYSGDLRTIYNESKKNLLHLACEEMEFRIVKYLIEKHDFSLTEQDQDGNTPLHIAISAEKVQTALYLLAHPYCDPNIKNEEGLTPLHVATRMKHTILINYMLGLSRLDRTVQDSNGRTAVEVIRGDPELAECLVRKTSTVSLAEPESKPSVRVPSRKCELGRIACCI